MKALVEYKNDITNNRVIRNIEGSNIDDILTKACTHGSVWHDWIKILSITE